MFMVRRLFLAGFSVVLLLPAAARAEWRVLGSRQVDRRGERDEIGVTAARGGFKKIKLKVTGASVEFKDVHVIYGNGEPDKLSVRETIPAGGETRAIDLQGRERIIRKIVFWYDTRGPGRQRATVTVFGWD
jgi:hypothetical protein